MKSATKLKKIIQVAVYSLIALQSLLLLQDFCRYHRQQQLRRERSDAASRRCRKRRAPRTSWQDFANSISDTHFRRMFRMDRQCFNELCTKIENMVGREEFKSQQYLDSHLAVSDDNPSPQSAIMHRAHRSWSGGYICGEVKVALTLRIMGGGQYVDLSHIFDIYYTDCYRIFHETLEKWICKDNIYPMAYDETVDDESALFDIAKYFALGRNGGILAGIMGALDGWLVRIRCPSYYGDGVRNSEKYFSRKGFYCLNVQVIVDRLKRVLWYSVRAKGSEHDSAAFKATNLYSQLEMLWETNRSIRNNGYGITFYLVGDSAYALRPFLVTPYDSALPGSAEDAFNYYQSASRIYVECAFGEITLRWGIFWTPLQFHISKHRYVIDAAFRLHNLLVDYRERNGKKSDLDFYSADTVKFMTANPNELVGVYGNGIDGIGINSGDSHMGRKNNVGRALRDALRDKMKDRNLTRFSKTTTWARSSNGITTISDYN